MNPSTRVLLGLVGEAPVVDDFPLGPRLASRLRERVWPAGLQVEVEGMNWGAMHVVQGLEGRRGHFDRAVLVACVQRGGAVGRVRLGDWAHETLPTLALQERIYEAVTGIVSLDNLLVIGEHFGVWPAEVLTVEVEAPQTLFGDMVSALAERAALNPRGPLQAQGLGGQAGAPPPWERLIGFDPDAVLLTLEEAVLRAVAGRGADGPGGFSSPGYGPFAWERRGTANMSEAEHWHIVTPTAPPVH